MKLRIVVSIVGVAAIAVLLVGVPLALAVDHLYESQEVLRASNLGQPVTISNAASAPARAYADAVRRLKGEDVDLTIPSEKKSFLGGLFTRRAA